MKFNKLNKYLDILYQFQLWLCFDKINYFLFYINILIKNNTAKKIDLFLIKIIFFQFDK